MKLLFEVFIINFHCIKCKVFDKSLSTYFISNNYYIYYTVFIQKSWMRRQRNVFNYINIILKNNCFHSHFINGSSNAFVQVL